MAESASDSATTISPVSIDRNASSNSTSANSASSSSTSDNTSLPYAGTLSSVAGALSNGGTDSVLSSAKSAAIGYASSATQQWFSQFGTARVQLNVDDNGNWDDSSFDFLIPLYDNKKAVLFSQAGLRAPDGRTTGNVGFGIRTFYTDNWMFGGNVFMDDDFTGKNRRIGFGAEAWTDYLKLSANTYVGTTEWHSSRDFDDYNEKPADGYDVRAEGYLPAYPQLGAKLVYEQYYGDKVALFDTDHLQSNPSAVTTGISYTPVPLIELAGNYKRGQDSMDDIEFQANFRYDFGHDWHYQLDPENVRAERSLAGSRYDLVERNNQIVLQYKKKEDQGISKLTMQVITDDSPADGLTPNTIQVFATNSHFEPVRNATITWSTSGTAKFSSPTTVTNADGIAVVNQTNTVATTVQVSAKNGNITASQDSHFDMVTVSHLSVTLDKDGSIADGVSPNSAIATVTDINNRPISNSKIEWSVTAPAKLQNSETTTDADGRARTEYVSTQPGATTIAANAGDQKASQQGAFISDSISAQISDFTVTTNNSPADGTTPDKVLVTVKDQNGNPVSDANVTLSADKNTVLFAGSTGHTDANGQLVVSLTDTVAQTATLTATLDNGNTKIVTAQFTPNSATAQLQDLIVTKDKSIADGVTTNTAEVTVKDANGNPVSAVNVVWSVDQSTAQIVSSSNTDPAGKATVSFTDTTAQSLSLKAQLANGSNLTTQSQFVANPATATLQNLTVTKDGSAANGNEANTAEVFVKDATGNPLMNQDVTWSSDKTGVIFNPGGKTDSNGKTTVSYTSNVAQNLQLSATLSNGQSVNAASLFVADTASERISTYTVTSGAVANGTATNTATVAVVDAQNNPVPDATLSWNVDGNAKLASSTGKTGPDGQLTVTFTDIKAETVNVKVQIPSGASETKPAAFVPDATTAKIGDYTVTTGAVANGTATNSGSVTVVDANGNPLTGISITWAVTGTAQLASKTGTTGNDGVATVKLTNTAAQEVNLTVTVGTESQELPTQFVADASTAVIQSLTLNTTDSPDNGIATNKVTAIVVDGKGNLLANQSITWSADKGTVQISPSGNTGSDGSASANFTDTVAESVSLKAQLSNGNNKTQISRFVADSSTAVIADMVVSTDNSRADGVQTNIVKVTVKDGTGNPLPNQNVQWSASRGGVALTPSGATDTNGNSTITMTDTQGGHVDITAKLDNGNSMIRTSTFLSLNVVSLTSNVDSQIANGSDTIIFTAVVKDSAGAVVTNTPVNFTTTGSATLSGNTVQTDSSGQATVTLKDNVGESVTVKATDGINTSDTGQSKSVMFNAAKITAITAGGQTFTPDSGFPQTGFISAQFQLVVDGDIANNSKYTWSANSEASAWIRIDSPGLVRLAATPSGGNTVTITATPTAGGQPITYTFTTKHWFVSEGQASEDPNYADALCVSRGRETPPYSSLSNGAPGSYGTRTVGTLWGEWGDLTQYHWSTAATTEYLWAKETATTGTGQRIYVGWRNGYVNDRVLKSTDSADIACIAY